jgi:hypothetical protein
VVSGGSRRWACAWAHQARRAWAHRARRAEGCAHDADVVRRRQQRRSSAAGWPGGSGAYGGAAGLVLGGPQCRSGHASARPGLLLSGPSAGTLELPQLGAVR